MASDGSRLLRLDASSVQTAPDGYRRIVWMIRWMIKAHPIERRMLSEVGVAEKLTASRCQQCRRDGSVMGYGT
jgi:hypothetical protein